MKQKLNLRNGPLRVCIDARIGVSEGGVLQTLIGLACGLSQLPDGEEEYLFLVNPGGAEWLTPYAGSRCRPLYTDQPAEAEPSPTVTLADRVWCRVRSVLGFSAAYPRSDGTIERAGVDVMHFALVSARGFRTRVRSVHTPHDLAYVHLGNTFHPEYRQRLERGNRTLANQADALAIMTAWGKADLVRHLGVPEAKVHVVPWAPVLSVYPRPEAGDLADVRRRFNLPEHFLIYPVHTYPHKNHLRLLEALALLRDQDGLKIQLITPGRPWQGHHEQIEQRMVTLGLQEQVRFLGYLTPLELRCLYQLSTLLVYPSLFDGWGMPLGEAMYAGLPIACSHAMCLPEVVGDAALLFDPLSPESTAAAIRTLWMDPQLRQSLADRGRRRVQDLTWENVARQYRAIYRLVGGRPLTAADHAALHGQPLLGMGGNDGQCQRQ